MPFYDKLRIQDEDADERKADKRRIANNLLELRNAWHEHIEQSEHAEPSVGTHVADKPHADDASKLLRLATWNIREFDSGKFGSRLEESYYYIAEILSSFDLIAIQEVRDNRAALDSVMDILGSAWDYIATDVTAGSGGNLERMVFVYNRNKCWFHHIAGELVLPKGQTIAYPYQERLRFVDTMEFELPAGEKLESPTGVKTYRRSGKDFLKEEVTVDLPEGTRIRLPEGAKLVLPRKYGVEVSGNQRVVLPEGTNPKFVEKKKDKQVMVNLPDNSIVGDRLQFARTPYLVTFQSGWLKLNLTTVHIYYGKEVEGMNRRKAEIRALTRFLSDRASRENDSDNDSFFVVLGDFNILSREHDTMKALLTNGFEVPTALQSVPGTNVDHTKAYDQIAYWTDPKGESSVNKGVTRFEVHRAGVFDFFDTVFRAEADDETFYKAKDYYKDGWNYREWRTHQMSDHLPMWIELRIDFSDEYLKDISSATP